MIIFHEGLPRAGKSYAAMVDHVIPALKKGRKVFAYIEGLDFERIAEASDLSLDRVRELLTQITREQVPTIYDHVENDSLVVIDELQNFWPNGRQAIPPKVTQFVTEHGHRGLDLLCMGQMLKDCAPLWRNRVDTKIVFRKRDAIGREDEYSWAVYKNVGDGKFKETTSGKKKYDPKYFGCYASHNEGTSNTDNYADERANVKNSKVYKFIKIYAVILVVAIAVVIWFFSSGGAGMGAKKSEKQVEVDPNKIAAQVNAQEVPKVAGSPPGQTPVPPQIQTSAKPLPTVDDYIDGLMTNGNRIRLAGALRTTKHVVGHIEWRDTSSRVIERLTFAELQGLGWFVMISADGGIATLSRPGKSYVATQWPIVDDRAGAPERVTEERQRAIKSSDDRPPAVVAAIASR